MNHAPNSHMLTIFSYACPVTIVMTYVVMVYLLFIFCAVCRIMFKQFKHFCVNHLSSVYLIDIKASLIIHQKNVHCKVEQGARKG